MTDNDPEEFEDVTARSGDFTCTLEYIGEGVSGDYNPDDPDDEPLLRFSCMKGDEEIENASYCTNLPASTSQEDAKKIAEYLLDELTGAYPSHKRRMQELSWIEGVRSIPVAHEAL